MRIYHFVFFLVVSLFGCSETRVMDCDEDANCDYGEYCEKNQCTVIEAQCSSDEMCGNNGRCIDDTGVMRCINRDGSCIDHQGCPVGAVCAISGYCSYPKAYDRSSCREDGFDHYVRNLKMFGPDGIEWAQSNSEDLELSWVLPESPKADAVIVAVFARPPLVSGGRIVNFDRDFLGYFATTNVDKETVLFADMTVPPDIEAANKRLPIGHAYWFGFALKEGWVFAFSDVFRFTVTSGVTTADEGESCELEEVCLSSLIDPVPLVCIVGECQRLCASTIEDCDLNQECIPLGNNSSLAMCVQNTLQYSPPD